MSSEENAQHVSVRVTGSARPDVVGEDPYVSEGDADEQTGNVENPLLLAHSLLRGRYLITGVLAVIAGAAGCVGGWFALKPTYQSVGIVQINPTIPSIVRDREGIIPMFDAYIESQLAVIRSDHVLGPTMLDLEWHALGRGMAPDAVADFTTSLTVTHPPGSQLIQIAFEDHDPAAAQLAARLVTQHYLELFRSTTSQDGDDLLRLVGNRIQVKQSQIKDIEERIDTITKAVGSAYIDKMVEGKIHERQDLGQKLNAVRLQLATLKALNPEPADEGSEAAASGTAAAATQASSGRKPSPLPVSIETLAARDPLLRDYVHQRSEIEFSLEGLKNRLGDNHIRVIESKSQLASINRRIDDLSAEMLPEWQLSKAGGGHTATGDPALIFDVDALRAQENVLQGQYDAANQAIRELGRQEIDIQNLRREKQGAQEDLDEAKRRKDDLTLTASITGRATALGMPNRPIRPSKDRRAALAVFGGLFGVCLAAGPVMFFGYVNRKLRHIADAHSGLCRGVPLLGILPELPRDMSDQDQASVAVHSVHKIRTMLQLAAGPTDSPKAFAISSPAAGDGKTSLTLALGLSFAACGARTLLIDFDLIGNGLTRRASRMIRPKLGSILRRRRAITTEQLRLALSEASNRRVCLGQALLAMSFVTHEQLADALDDQKKSLVGLLDVLGGEPLDECVNGAGVNGLFVLPVGSATAAHTGRLSPRCVRQLIEEAKKEFDVIIVDTGPVLGSLEASIVAPAVDGVVMAVSRGEQRLLARRSMDHIVSTGGRILGVVFNRAQQYDVLSSQFSSSTSTRLLSRPVQDQSESAAG